MFWEAAYTSAATQESGLPGWTQTYRQLSPGPFEGRVTGARLDGVTIVRERASRRVDNLFLGPERCAIFFLHLPGSGGATAGGRRYGPSDSGVLVERRESAAVLHEGFDALLVTLPAERLETVEASAAARLAPERARDVADLGLGVLEALRTNAAPAEDLARIAPGLICDRILALADRADWRDGARWRARRLMDEVRELAAEGDSAELTVSAIAARLDRLPRELRRACLEETGVRLDALLAAWRLDFARRDLAAARPGETTVARVASRHGFLHWGRFSQVYKAHFGETPAVTLRRPR